MKFAEKPDLVMPDGIYFDLDEDRYHSLQRLSNSGEKKLLISPADFWVKSPWNPLKDDEDGGDMSWAHIGRAYHTARFEPHLFDDRFAPEKGPSDFPDALTSSAQIGDKLTEFGEPKTKKGERVADQWARLKGLGFQGQYLPEVLAEYEADCAQRGVTLLPQKVIDDIGRDMRRIDDNPEVARLLRGGQAEVSVLWTDEETGIKMKCRIDQLQPKLFTDFKSFANRNGKPVRQAIIDAIRYNGYYMQATSYWMATEVIRSGKVNIVGEATPEQRGLIDDIKLNPEPLECWFVFQEKNGKPNLFAFRFAIQRERMDHTSQRIGAEDAVADRRFTHEFSVFAMKAQIESRHAKRLFLTMVEVHGHENPWYPVQMVHDLTDEDFSPYFLDETPEGYKG